MSYWKEYTMLQNFEGGRKFKSPDERFTLIKFGRKNKFMLDDFQGIAIDLGTGNTRRAKKLGFAEVCTILQSERYLEGKWGRK